MSHVPEDDHVPMEPPINPVPPVIWGIVLIIAVVELVLSAAGYGLIGGADGIGWRNSAAENFGFFTKVFDWMVENGVYPLHHMWRFVTYNFVQANWTQALFVCVFVLSLGKFLAEDIGQWRALLVFVLSGLIAAVVYGVVSTSNVPLIGGYPAAFGLIGAYSIALFHRLKAAGQDPKMAIYVVVFFGGVVSVYGIFWSPSIIWITQLVGLIAGVVVGWLLRPGRWTWFLTRVRARG